jgi:hypothetical protein
MTGRLLAALLLISTSGALGQNCKVLDPELQGFYAGGCEMGLAEGLGHARGRAEYQG